MQSHTSVTVIDACVLAFLNDVCRSNLLPNKSDAKRARKEGHIDVCLVESFFMSSFILAFTGGVISWPPSSLDGVVRQLRPECCGCAKLHVWPGSTAPQGPPNLGEHGIGAA